MAVINDSYTQLLLSLSPSGLAWPRDPSTRLVKNLSAYADSLARIHRQATNLIEELDPRTTNHLLPEWERCYGLPNSCSPSSQVVVDRLTNLLFLFQGRFGQSVEFFIDLARHLGIVGTITEFECFRCGFSQLGIDELNSIEALFTWVFHSANVGGFIYFTCGESELGEPLLSFKTHTELECIFNLLKPAHTQVIFSYT